MLSLCGPPPEKLQEMLFNYLFYMAISGLFGGLGVTPGMLIMLRLVTFLLSFFPSFFLEGSLLRVDSLPLVSTNLSHHLAVSERVCFLDQSLQSTEVSPWALVVS